MKKEGRSKIMPVLLTFILVLSTMIFFPPMQISAALEISKTTGVTCGEKIWVNVTDESLDSEQEYWVAIEKTNGTGDFINITDGESDEKGNIEVEVEVPYRSIPETYAIRLVNKSDTADFQAGTITIKSVYNLIYSVGTLGNTVDHVLYNGSYWTGELGNFWIQIENMSDTHDEEVKVTVYEPNGAIADAASDNCSDGDVFFEILFDYMETTPDNYETEYYVIVEEGSPGVVMANHTLPVKLDVELETTLNDQVWSDNTVTATVRVKDGAGNIIPDYQYMELYSPWGSYNLMDQEETNPNTGRATLSAVLDDGAAGRWWIGSRVTGASYRIDETDELNIPDFVRYYHFDVLTDDSAKVRIVDPDEIVTGFMQTLNISVYNDSSWTGTPFDEMNLHVTGLECTFEGTLYEEDEVVTVADSNNVTGYSSNEKYAYYEFDIIFEETGSGQIIVTYPGNNSYYEDMDDLEANISGSTTFTIGSPDDMTIIVKGMPEGVVVVPEPGHSCCWKNDSTDITIEIYGSEQDDEMNASIEITGCGLDIEADEEDKEYWQSKGVYVIPISPKTAGTVTITVSNDTENISTSKDFSVKGLSGSVTTSDGDDLEISVETSESITATITSGQYAEVRLCKFDEDWAYEGCVNDTVGDGTAGNGLNGVFDFFPDEDFLENVGFIVVAANAGEYYMYDIVEIVPIHDLVISMLDPDNVSDQILTCGLEHDWEFRVLDLNGSIVDDVDDVEGELIDEEGDVLQTMSYANGDIKKKSGNIWYFDDWVPHFGCEFVLTAVNNSGENEHDGNVTIDCGKAVITYSVEAVTAGIGTENVTVEVMGVDAVGNLLPDGTKLFVTIEDAAGTDTDPVDGEYFTLDEDGEGEFDIDCVGDKSGKINVTLQGAYDTDYMGNTTEGEVLVIYPNFDVNPPYVYINEVNELVITATDYQGNPIKGINVTLISSSPLVEGQPDPQETDANGQVILSVSPSNSGSYNVTIARNVSYDNNGQLMWTNDVITDSSIDIIGRKSLTITVSQSPIFEKDTLTVTITSGATPVSEVSVKFAGETVLTDSAGKATFTVPDPGVEFVVYTITAEKARYSTETLSITVIKKWDITITGPSTAPGAGEKFTVSIFAKGSPLAGATITMDGETYTSDADGKVTITAPSDEGDYVVTATYENYDGATLTITIKAGGGIPGFELLTLIAAIGVAFILLKRRRN
jgi:hypothetical protein